VLILVFRVLYCTPLTFSGPFANIVRLVNLPAYSLVYADAAVADKVMRLGQQAAETARLQTSLDEMSRQVEERIIAAVDAQRQRTQDDLSTRMDALTQQREYGLADHITSAENISINVFSILFAVPSRSENLRVSNTNSPSSLGP